MPRRSQLQVCARNPFARQFVLQAGVGSSFATTARGTGPAAGLRPVQPESEWGEAPCVTFVGPGTSLGSPNCNPGGQSSRFLIGGASGPCACRFSAWCARVVSVRVVRVLFQRVLFQRVVCACCFGACCFSACCFGACCTWRFRRNRVATWVRVWFRMVLQRCSTAAIGETRSSFEACRSPQRRGLI